jgi:hypothetical protein
MSRQFFGNAGLPFAGVNKFLIVFNIWLGIFFPNEGRDKAFHRNQFAFGGAPR